jgi:hypothetical protein
LIARKRTAGYRSPTVKNSRTVRFPVVHSSIAVLFCAIKGRLLTQ